jgi:hypothetical protein
MRDGSLRRIDQAFGDRLICDACRGHYTAGELPAGALCPLCETGSLRELDPDD